MAEKATRFIVAAAAAVLLLTGCGDDELPRLAGVDDLSELTGRIYFETGIPGSQIPRTRDMNPDGTDVQSFSGVLDEDTGPLWEGCSRGWAYSPDRSRVVYGTCECKEGKDISGGNIPVDCEYRLYTADADRPEAILVASADYPDLLFSGGLSWSPDGTCFAVALEGDIWLMDAAGAWRANLTESPEFDRNPRWLKSAEPSPSPH